MGLLRTCCCGCSLRTGTIIIGSLSLIFSTIYLCVIITAMVLVQASDDQTNAKTDVGRTDFSSDLSSRSFNFESKSDRLNNFKISMNDLVSANGVNDDTYYSSGVFDMKSLTVELLSLCAVGVSITVITSILLIFGAAKGFMWFLLPWIANVSLGIIAYIVTSIYQLVKLSNSLTGEKIFLSILVTLAVLALDIYLLMVVISHFEELRKNRREEGTNIGKIYSAPSPWSSSQVQIIPNVPEKESA